MQSQPAPFPRYQCPGESREISRAVHLGRLASFYPACRNCVCRTDAGHLPPSHLEHLAEVFAAAPVASLLFDEGLVGIDPTDVHPTLIRRAAAAFAQTLADSGSLDIARGPVLIGCDDRPTTSELIAAAAEGLRMAEIDVIEIGSASSGSFSHALTALNACGGLLIGNARGRRREVSLKFWLAAGQPLSSGESLTALEQHVLSNPPRTARKSGKLARATCEGDYLAELAPIFHAFRPLRVAIDCACAPWWRHLRLLSASVGCEFVPHQVAPPCEQTAAEDFLNADGIAAQGPFDFYLWADGDGESVRVWDERGKRVEPSEMLQLLALRLLREQGEATVVVPESFPVKSRHKLARAGGRVEAASSNSRQAMHARLVESGALFGGDANCRYWFAAPTPRPDALQVLAVLLNSLSESDEPLSLRVADL